MANTIAAQLIAQLIAQGNTKSQIAKKLQRDSSIISQISNGKKSGAKYVPELQRMLAGDEVTAPSRRTKKSGNTANVRRGAIKDDKHRIVNTISKTPDGALVLQILKKIEKNNGRVGVIITFGQYQAYEMNKPARMDIPLWSNGVTAKWINNHLDEGMTFTELLINQVYLAYNPTVAHNIVAVQINAVY